jgi:hypothetical protein
VTSGDRTSHPSPQESVFALLDLLSVEDEARMNAHLADCRSCREWMDRARTHIESKDLFEHIPASVIARWTRIEPTMGFHERSLMERHLRSCRVCDEALSAVLAETPAPKGVVEHEFVPVAAAGRGDRRMRWAPAAWGLGLATAALLLFVFWPRPAKEPTHSPSIAVAPDSIAPSTADSTAGAQTIAGRDSGRRATRPTGAITIALGPERGGDAIELFPQQRASSGDAPEIVAAGAERSLRFRIPPIPLLDPAHSVQVRLLGPGDLELAADTTVLGTLMDRPTLELSTRRPWAAGEYRIEIRDLTLPGPGLEPESVSFPFLIR